MSYSVGDRVIIKKYGKEYVGTVTATGRVTVTVEFKTIGGATKTIKVSGRDVPYLIKPLMITRGR